MSSRNTRSSTKRRDKRDKTKREKFAAKKRQKVDAKRREEEHSKDMHATYGTTPVRGVVEDWDDQSRIRNTVISDESISSLEEVSKRESRFREAKSHMTLMSRNPCYNSIIDKNPRRKIDCSSDELRGFAYSNGLPTYGTKEELVDRIRFYLNKKIASGDRASGRPYSFRRSPCHAYSTMVPNSLETIKSKRQIIRSQFRGITNDNWKVKINSFFLERLYTLYDRHFFDNKLKKMISERGHRVIMSWDTHIKTGLDTLASVIPNRCGVCENGRFCDKLGSKCHEIYLRFKPIKFVHLLESGGSLPSSTAGEPAFTDVLMAIMETFEHELVHVIMTAFCPKEEYRDNQGSWKGICNASTAHPRLFMTILNNIFGHTRFRHVASESTEPWNQPIELVREEDEKTELDVYKARAEYSSQLIKKGKGRTRVDAIKSGLLERMKLGLGTFRGQDLSNSALTTPWKEMTSLYTPGIDKDSKASVDLHRSIADQGHMNTQYRVGRFYYDGQGVEKDFETAARYFKMAAEQGHKMAHHYLGLLYYAGTGVAQDYKQAAFYFTSAVQSGIVEARNYLGLLYYAGTGVAQDYKQAALYFRMAAVDRSLKGIYLLAKCYYFGEGVILDLDIATRYFKNAADRGHSEARSKMDQLIKYNELKAGKSDVEVDYLTGKLFLDERVKLGLSYLESAADKGHVVAQITIAQMYLDGKRVDRNLEKAKRYFKMAADRGNGEGQYKYHDLVLYSKEGKVAFSPVDKHRLGMLYKYIGNFDKAIKHLKSAAEGKYLNAEYDLGMLYSYLGTGKGGEEWLDIDTAQESKKWLKSAADQNHVYAQYHWGWLLILDDKMEEGLPYVVKAADLGHTEAQYRLWTLFSKHADLDQQNIALQYLKKAADLGHTEAQYRLWTLFSKHADLDQQNIALQYLKKAADQNHREAQYRMWMEFFKHTDRDKQNMALQYLKKAADGGHMDAQYKMWMVFSKFRDIGKRKIAIQYLRMAADGGHTEAQYEMWMVFSRRRDPPGQLALKYLRMAADGGHTEAQYRLWTLFSKHTDLDQQNIALQYLKKAADQNHREAQYRMWMVFSKHTDLVQQNIALQYLKKAADGGHNSARNILTRSSQAVSSS